jgi:RNA polymerase sigma-70 factor (ECF subfamily)
VRAPPLNIGVPGPASPVARSSSGPPDTARPTGPAWPELNPETLVHAQAGEPRALGAFFDHYVGRIFSVAHRFTGNAEAARDVTQDVFLKIRRHLPRLDLASDPGGWVYTVVVNACRDHRRSAWWRMSRNSVPIDHPAAESALSSRDGDPERAALAAEGERRVHAALRRLAPDLRMSIVLHDFERLPHEEIAGIVGISHAAARKRHSRAMDALARLLKETETR